MVSSAKAGGRMNQTISYGYTGSGPATTSNPNSFRGQVIVTLPALSWNFLREKTVPLTHRLVGSCILKLLILKILPMPFIAVCMLAGAFPIPVFFLFFAPRAQHFIIPGKNDF